LGSSGPGPGMARTLDLWGDAICGRAVS
jgi:hypothetical protein